jgi:MFS family permease
VAAIAFASVTGALMQALVVPLLPRLPALLHSNESAVSWLVTGMLLSGAISNVLCGRLGDMYGKRRMILVCLLSLVVGSVLGAATTSLPLLVLARVLQGVAMGVVPLGISTMADLLDGDLLIKGITLASATAGVGASLGFAVSALVADIAPWQILFVGSAVVGALALVGVLVVVPPVPGSTDSRLDVVGAAGLTLGVAGVLIAITSGNGWGWLSLRTLSCLAGGLAVLALWGGYQLRIPHALIDLRTAARRPVLFTNLATMLVGFSMYGMILIQPQLIQLSARTGFGLGGSLLVSGLVTVPGGIASLFVPGPAARLTERYGPRATMTTGIAVLVIGFAFVALAHAEIWQLAVAGTLSSIGVVFFSGAVPDLLMRHVPRSGTGQANGINGLARSFGTSTSSALTSALLAGILISTGFGAGRLPSETAFLVLFAVCGGAGMLAAVATGLVGREPSHGTADL